MPDRMASVIQVRPGRLDEYQRLHAQVWPDVLATLRSCHISNYSIFVRGTLLFSYLEYDGDDWDADSARMAADPATQRWWDVVKPCQQPMPDASTDQWWAPMRSVFYLS